MNVFYLDSNPMLCAKYHCDVHVIKMLLETAQLLSTAHRLHDGKLTEFINPINKTRTVKRYILPDEKYHWYNENDSGYKLQCKQDKVLYQATHIHHPSALWARKNTGNYNWLWCLMLYLHNEYVARYGKAHKTWLDLGTKLRNPPANLPKGEKTTPPQCMPEKYYHTDCVQAYRSYYLGEKKPFAKWKRHTPSWWSK